MTDIGLLLLRLLPSLMMMPHGWQKLMNFSTYATQFPDPLGLGPVISLGLTIFAELLCPLLIILGMGTRLASIPLVITMLVAALVIHSNDPWAKQEFPLLYGAVYLALFFTGGGKYAIGRRFNSMWINS